MNTPVCDFIEKYVSLDMARFHMPGHKGVPSLGCEPWDITEVKGADALYEADGILAESERNAASLFGTAATFYSTEGSSHCIRAMLYLLSLVRKGPRLRIAAARNAHKAFVFGAALADADVTWIFGEDDRTGAPWTCRITAERLDALLSEDRPDAVFLTSPDYLGHLQDIRAISAVCRRHGVLLAVDNAHGAYLRFLPGSAHPLDLGADICCDSAHKTLPVLTGGAYLHIGKQAPPRFAAQAKQALALSGSTSPSYLTLASLDRCNRYLAEDGPALIGACAASVRCVRTRLRAMGYRVWPSDPLRITLRMPGYGHTAADALRAFGIECEYADRDFLVLMLSPANVPEDTEKLCRALRALKGSWPAADGDGRDVPADGPDGAEAAPGNAEAGPEDRRTEDADMKPSDAPRPVMRIRDAVFSPSVRIPVREAIGRVAASPEAACPPAVPIGLPGERLDEGLVRRLLA
ncbi:MAG: PLP-dependent transferase [Lachnospiraceae bacterium]|nr:PLP-dependent transferase [Lachnospiraceae bacterium]